MEERRKQVASFCLDAMKRIPVACVIVTAVLPVPGRWIVSPSSKNDQFG
jgi:hypothetical protein